MSNEKISLNRGKCIMMKFRVCKGMIIKEFRVWLKKKEISVKQFYELDDKEKDRLAVKFIKEV